MKTTNMNNTTNITAITEVKYISNYREIRNEDGNSNVNIQVAPCGTMEDALSSYIFSLWGEFNVINLATGEERVYDHVELKAWCSTLTLAEFANYHLSRTRYYGEACYIEEYYFTVIDQTDEVVGEKSPLWKLEVYNTDSDELIDRKDRILSFYNEFFDI